MIYWCGHEITRTVLVLEMVNTTVVTITYFILCIQKQIIVVMVILNTFVLTSQLQL